jgi:GT2 family glycosyltransferase
MSPETSASETGAPEIGAPEIGIIVPHLNQPDRLERLLASLFAQDFDMGRAEVVVVDNGSREMPEAVAAGFPGVRLVRAAEVPGPGPARNRGAALTRAPILAFTDSDCEVDPGWAGAILARFAADPALAVLGGDVRVRAEDPARPGAAEAYEMVYAFPQRLYVEKRGFSATSNMAVRRAVFEAVGPFAGIEIAEDTDWGQRATALGYRPVYAPEMVVHHPARRTLGEIFTKWNRNVSHHYAAFARGPAGKAKWIARAGAMVLSPVGEIPRLLTTGRLSGPAMRARAFGALVAIRLYRAGRMLAVMVRSDVRTASLQWNRQAKTDPVPEENRSRTP